MHPDSRALVRPDHQCLAMTQEELCPRLKEELIASSGNTSEDEDVIIRPDRASVRDMILRFEKTALNNGESSVSSESLERFKGVGSLTSVVNPIHNHFQHLAPVTRSQDRNSNVSVNSILSNASEISFESTSSGFVSDRKSVPHRMAPPPPAPFNDSSSSESKSPVPEENVVVERRYSFTTPSGSPVVLRRLRQPPVIRRKSGTGNQGHLGETLWSYGVRQSDLEKLLRLKISDLSENEEEEPKYDNTPEASGNESSSDDSNDSEKSEGNEYVVTVDDGRTDTLSTDHSTDTLINEEDSGDEEDGDNLSVVSGERSNYDNVSIKSISSLDMVPYQKYDSITVSSDEFGSEVCHAADTEFLTVSAVNEWCVSKSIQPILLPAESKKEKYRR